jgi:hypothetical protein
MAFTVLKVSKNSENQIEVVGEFPTEEDAKKFAEDAQKDDASNEYEYIIERPPSQLN